jgi:hypothetical protein
MFLNFGAITFTIFGAIVFKLWDALITLDGKFSIVGHERVPNDFLIRRRKARRFQQDLNWSSRLLTVLRLILKRFSTGHLH